MFLGPSISVLEIQPLFFFFLFKDFIYLLMRDTQREREAKTQAEGEAGSMQGARHGTRSWVSRITPWAEGGAKPLSHSGCPKMQILIQKVWVDVKILHFQEAPR